MPVAIGAPYGLSVGLVWGSSTSSLTSSLCVRVLRVLRDAEPSPTVLPWPKAKKVPLSE